MGDNGENFSAPLLGRARAEGWVLIAPTFSYGDWRNPAQLRVEGPSLVSYLRDLVIRLPREVDVSLQRRVLLYGFSRGAQLAQRFALAHPELVLGAAVLSAGVYTLPLETMETEDGRVDLLFPYGVADFAVRFGHRLDVERLRQVQFMVGVGELDNDPSSVPRQWDPYIGRTRVERARTFAESLKHLGVPTTLMIVKGKGHDSSGEPQEAALDFLRALLETAEWKGSWLSE